MMYIILIKVKLTLTTILNMLILIIPHHVLGNLEHAWTAFLNISTLFCKTCNIFLCAICNVKLHNNKSNHIINVASSGLYENNVKFNDIILKEKDKWLVELDNSIPIKNSRKMFCSY